MMAQDSPFADENNGRGGVRQVVEIDDADFDSTQDGSSEDPGVGVDHKPREATYAPGDPAMERIARFRWMSFALSCAVCIFIYVNSMRPRDYSASASLEVGGRHRKSVATGFEGVLLGAHRTIRQWFALESALEQYYGVFFRTGNQRTNLSYSVCVGFQCYDSGTSGDFDTNLFAMQSDFNHAMFGTPSFGCLPSDTEGRIFTPAINYAFLPQSVLRNQLERRNKKRLHLDVSGSIGMPSRRRLQEGGFLSTEQHSDKFESGQNSNFTQPAAVRRSTAAPSNGAVTSGRPLIRDGELVVARLPVNPLMPATDEEARLATTGLEPPRLAVILLNGDKEVNMAIWRAWLKQGTEYSGKENLGHNRNESSNTNLSEMESSLAHVYIPTVGAAPELRKKSKFHHIPGSGALPIEGKRQLLAWRFLEMENDSLSATGISPVLVAADDTPTMRLFRLLEAAHEDPQVHFTLVLSDAEVAPLQTVRKIHNELLTSGRSLFGFSTDPLPMFLRKHSPDFLLIRRHVAALLANPHLWICDNSLVATVKIPIPLQSETTRAATGGRDTAVLTAKPISFLPFNALQLIFGPMSIEKEINSGDVTRPAIEDFVQFEPKTWSWRPMPVLGCTDDKSCCSLGECEARSDESRYRHFSTIDDSTFKRILPHHWCFSGVDSKTKLVNGSGDQSLMEFLLDRFSSPSS